MDDAGWGAPTGLRAFLLGFALAALGSSLFPARAPPAAHMSALRGGGEEAPQNVYFDIGANNGDSVTAFLASRDLFFSVVLVEANPAFTPVLRALCAQVVADGRARACEALVETAITTFDGSVQLFAEQSSGWASASSIVPESSIVRGPGARVNTTALDIVTLFRARRKGPQDFWAIKIDIEGAEFQVIPRAIFHGVTARWDEVSVEWHDTNKWIFEANAARTAIRENCQAFWKMMGIIDLPWARR